MKKKDMNELENWPVHLRGEAKNKRVRHKVQKSRRYRGNTYGAASECKTYTAEQTAAWVKANGHTC